MTVLPCELESAPQWAIDVFQNLQPLAGYDDVAPLVRMSRGSIANLLSQGRGPDGGVLIGRKRVFPRLNVVLWLLDMAAQKERGAA